MYDVIIAGGGFSGLCAAIEAKKTNKRVLIIEKSNRLGKKILVTGNGRCNLANTYIDEQCFRSDNLKLFNNAFKDLDYKYITKYFNSLGLYTTDKNGYIYPMSLQASTVLNLFEDLVKELNIEVLLNSDIIKVKHNKFFSIYISGNDKVYESNKLILATGGKAYIKNYEDYMGYDIAKSLGHTIIKPLPALVGLKSKDKFLKKAGKIRVGAKASLYIDNSYITSNQGELQLTEYGISGVMIFMLSRYCNKAITENKNVKILIDFMPDYNENELCDIILDIHNNRSRLNIYQLLCGLINNNLANALVAAASNNRNLHIESWSKDDVKYFINKYIKNYYLDIYDSLDFSMAQVTQGGIPLDEVDLTKMESKKCNNLYMCGELLDIDGTCGGYNIMWAIASGIRAGKGI